MNPKAVALMWYFTAVTAVVLVVAAPFAWIPLVVWGLYVLYAIVD